MLWDLGTPDVEGRRTPVRPEHFDICGPLPPPGVTVLEASAGTGKTFEQVFRERAAASTAKRYGDPVELGAYCAFLCSVHAGYITGQNLLIDGGSYPGAF